MMKTTYLNFSIGLSVLFLLTACNGSEEPNNPIQPSEQEGAEEVSAEIEQANYCETDADCEYVGSKCPFGCYLYAHTDEAARIRGLIDAYQSTCVYSCIRSEGVACVDNTCQAITE